MAEITETEKAAADAQAAQVKARKALAGRTLGADVYTHDPDTGEQVLLLAGTKVSTLAAGYVDWLADKPHLFEDPNEIGGAYQTEQPGGIRVVGGR